MYNRYRVIACSYRISVASSNTASQLQLAVVPTNEPITPSSLSEVREQPRARYTLQGAMGSPLRFVTGKVYIPSLMGRTKAQYMADDRFQAPFGQSPAELALLNLYAGFLNEGTAINETMIFNVELEYTVECFDIKHLNQS